MMKGRCWLLFPVALLLAAEGPVQVKGEPRQKTGEAAAPPAKPVLERKGYLVAVRTVTVSPEVSERVTFLTVLCGHAGLRLAVEPPPGLLRL
ncbi:MAG TPA: hypothetical protein VGY66_15460 [Gemmataceae bacterium]|nr:hypothetical protein [Gemmataceae bacterium]